MDLTEGVGESSSPPRSFVCFNNYDVRNDVFNRLVETGHREAASQPEFRDQLDAHFNRLPASYGLDVNMDRVEDVLIHQKLLALAKDPEKRPVYHIRFLESISSRTDDDEDEEFTNRVSTSRLSFDVTNEGAVPPHDRNFASEFEPCSKLGDLNLDVRKNSKDMDDSDLKDNFPKRRDISRILTHEVIFSSIDKPKLLSQLSALLSDIGLNIREAHVFSTTDGYSLDVFVVDGWPFEDTDGLNEAMEKAIARSEVVEELTAPFIPSTNPLSLPLASGLYEDETKDCTNYSSYASLSMLWDAVTWTLLFIGHMHLSVYRGSWSRSSHSHSAVEKALAAQEKPGNWEIDRRLLKIGDKIASGSCGDLHRGIYLGQDVAVKILRSEHLNAAQEVEFAQEVAILREVHHRNVVRFIGACTKSPHLCIVTEYMPGGSLYDYLHKSHNVLKFRELLKFAIDVCKGMEYLHHNDIIHRDLKTANLLMDSDNVVKVADFGVARFQTQGGVMTAETGTYRWMAPEVINHQPYDQKADVFSFAIVLWELVTAKVPYDTMTPLQAALGVRQGLRPELPTDAHPKVIDLMQRCWDADPSNRPAFSDITVELETLFLEVQDMAEATSGT